MMQSPKPSKDLPAAQLQYKASHEDSMAGSSDIGPEYLGLPRQTVRRRPAVWCMARHGVYEHGRPRLPFVITAKLIAGPGGSASDIQGTSCKVRTEFMYR
jgi:hypothetical protein